MAIDGRAEWNGVKKGALGNAIRERLHTLVDALSPLKVEGELVQTRMEIVALLDQFPNLPEQPR
jgi:hypothetical protein